MPITTMDAMCLSGGDREDLRADWGYRVLNLVSVIVRHSEFNGAQKGRNFGLLCSLNEVKCLKMGLPILDT